MTTLEMPIGRSSGDTHPGKKRENNEDRFYCDPERGIFIVIDGVGGQAAGEVAAGIALEELHGMACVLTVAVIENNQATIGHVGDTRLYEIHRGQIRKITHDHSPVGEREEAGELTELEAMRHPRRNEIYCDVGSEPHELEDEDFIEVIQIPFDPDSALLLCSDGLTDLVTSEKIRQVVERNAGNPLAVGMSIMNADVEIEDVEISGATDAGILIDGMSLAILRANYVHDNRGTGVIIKGNAGPRLINNLILHNGKQIAKGNPGVEIVELANPILMGNVIAENGAAGILTTSILNREELLQKNFFSIEGKLNKDGNVSVVGK